MWDAGTIKGEYGKKDDEDGKGGYCVSEEALWEYWENNYGRVVINNDMLAYIKGERDHYTKMQNANKKSYIALPTDLIPYLEGEDAELAKRMIQVLLSVRRQGYIEQYNREGSTKLCAMVGFPFEQIVAENDLDREKFWPDDLYQLAQAFVDGYGKEETARQVKLFFNTFSGNHSTKLYLYLYFVSILILEDPGKYPELFSILEDYCLQTERDHTVKLLHLHYQQSEKLLKRFTCMLENNFVAVNYLSITLRDEFRPFIRNLGVSEVIYHEAVILGNVASPNTGMHFRSLYRENKDDFMKTLEFLLRNKFIQSAFLISILLQNGEGKEYLEDVEHIFLDKTKELNMCFRCSFRDLLLDESKPLDKIAESIQVTNRYYGLSNDAIRNELSACALLFSYSPLAEKMYSLLFLTAERENFYYLFGELYRSFTVARCDWLDIPKTETIDLLFQNGWDFELLLKNFSFNVSSWGENPMDKDSILAYLQAHPDETLTYVPREKGRDASGTVVIIDMLYSSGMDDYTLLYKMMGSKSKQVLKKCEELLLEHEEETRPELEKMQPSLKGEAAQLVRKLIRRWDNERKFGKDFAFKSNDLLIEFCTENYNKPKEKSITWIPEELLSSVRYADLSGTAPAIVLKYVLVEYMTLTEIYRLKSCDRVIEKLNPLDYQRVLEEVFQIWKENGAEAKQKMILAPYCIYGSDTQIIAMRRQLEQWAENMRGALAAFAVNCIALNGGSVALMMIDSIGTKFKYNQVKKAAKLAFAFAAKALDLPQEELADRIVPTLGFSPDGEKTLDYGSRTFKITLLPDFSFSIFDQAKGKNVKSMPKPAATDDQVKAEAARKEFSEMKKQLKAVVQAQTRRLERVLLDGRCWPVDRFKKLFVDNPIMHRFAVGLIWGVYQDNKLETAFRYMEDGTFNTVDEDEYTLPENAEITLAHPSDLTNEELEAWRQQLEDYEIVQPLPQLAAKAIALTQADIDRKRIIRWENRNFPAGRMTAAANKYNMVRGEILDGGSFECYHFVDRYLGIAAVFHFEYMFMYIGFDESVTMQKLTFYRLPEDGYTMDEPKENLIVDPRDLPSRFVSSILAIGDAIVE